MVFGFWEFLLALLAGAVLLVALLRLAGLPTLPAYVLLGAAAGPHGFAVLPHSEAVSLAAEIGVALLMFTIGLKFSLSKLREFRRHVFLLGGLQFIATLIPAAVIALAFGLTWIEALVAGSVAALSSTAIASRLLIEKNEVATPHGGRAIGVLLFQDLAVIPLLIIIASWSSPGDLIWLDVGLAGIKIVLTLVVVLYFGPRILPRWFDWIADRRSDELFVLNLVLVIVLLSWLTHLFGLSLVLGAFLAGILIAETLHRFRVAEIVAPFRELFLGFFFVTIGALLSPADLMKNLGWILLAAAGLIVFKTALVAGLARVVGSHAATALKVGLLIGGAGEFGFVLLAEADRFNLINSELFQLLLPANILAMLAIPFLWSNANWLVERIISRDWLHRAADLHKLMVKSNRLRHHVVLCGFGRTGRMMASLFRAEGIKYIALEDDGDLIERAMLENLPALFGDARSVEVLQAAGAAQAAALVITHHHAPSAMATICAARTLNPKMPIIAKAFNAEEAEMLRAAGAADAIVEPHESGLTMASRALMLCGMPDAMIERAVEEARSESGGTPSDAVLARADIPELPRYEAVKIGENAAAVGKNLRALPPDVQVISLRREGRAMPSPAECEIQAGDVVVLLGCPGDLESAEKSLIVGADAQSESPENR